MWLLAAAHVSTILTKHTKLATLTSNIPRNAHRTFSPSFSSLITVFQTKSILTWP